MDQHATLVVGIEPRGDNGTILDSPGGSSRPVEELCARANIECGIHNEEGGQGLGNLR